LERETCTRCVFPISPRVLLPLLFFTSNRNKYIRPRRLVAFEIATVPHPCQFIQAMPLSPRSERKERGNEAIVAVLAVELWIQIHWIWIRIQHFKWIRIQSGFRFWWPKAEEKNTAGKFVKVLFLSKIAVYLCVSHRRNLHTSKENIQHLKKKLLTFQCLWVIFALLHSDPGTPSNPDPIRIRILIHNTD
jgi:hypothetical protein